MSRAPSRAFTFRLPHRALWIALGAFAAGLLLFGIVWLSNRKDDTFYSVKPADKTGEAAAIDPLPEPMTAQDSASGMKAPSADAQAQAAAAQNGDGTGAFPKPMLEDSPENAANGAPAPNVAAANEAPPEDRVTPMPIDGQSPPPTYPQAALRRGETGTVMVRIQVDAQGNPGGVALTQRSGSRDLDRAAMEAVRKWHFAPAIRDGAPVAGTVDIPVEFNLQR
ncbi:outer membrane transport energization protein TonB [Pseudoxanthomonas sp. GM95]|uniref:energy transducer TonB n=1 Tax=Pseudoxanthomonas sp. GM95 TaxID=1881043 RepID=UPI0008B82DB9|nr:energy transducer TonB [Pseudoxanthomonas sp. GM95]SEL90777.1 outer membrane transport energization protein TonB [Pseudoxanthomonas sp. GM95]